MAGISEGSAHGDELTGPELPEQPVKNATGMVSLGQKRDLEDSGTLADPRQKDGLGRGDGMLWDGGGFWGSVATIHALWNLFGLLVLLDH